jgi:hypothetical protein
MAILNYAMCHNIKSYKMKNHNWWWRSIFQKNINFHPKIPIVPCVRFWWINEKQCLTWRYHASYKLVALELQIYCSYIIVTKLHKLHMYMVSYIMNQTSVATHVICLIALMPKEIYWVIMHCKWSLQLKNPFARLVTNHPIFS